MKPTYIYTELKDGASKENIFTREFNSLDEINRVCGPRDNNYFFDCVDDNEKIDYLCMKIGSANASSVNIYKK